MKSYIKNVLDSLLGRNPYKRELNTVKARLLVSREKYDALSKRFDRLKADYDNFSRQILSLQNLVETLRQHIAEKDELTSRMKQDYQKRIDAYNVQIDELRKAYSWLLVN